jgi:hypothetical protein
MTTMLTFSKFKGEYETKLGEPLQPNGVEWHLMLREWRTVRDNALVAIAIEIGATTLKSGDRVPEVVIPTFADYLAAYEMRVHGRRRSVPGRSKEEYEVSKAWSAEKKEAMAANEQIKAQNADIDAEREKIINRYFEGLSGTPAQMSWAADIRFERLGEMASEDRNIFGRAPSKAELWINNRNITTSDFVAAFREMFE